MAPPPTAEETVGTATFLFLDVVRSSEFLSEHGESAADDVRHALLAVCDAAASHRGEVVKSLGGAGRPR